MASINDTVAAELNSAIQKVARKIYHKNFKLSSNEVANLMEAYLVKITNEKTMLGLMLNKEETLAHRLAYNAVIDIDNVNNLK